MTFNEFKTWVDRPIGRTGVALCIVLSTFMLVLLIWRWLTP